MEIGLRQYLLFLFSLSWSRVSRIFTRKISPYTEHFVYPLQDWSDNAYPLSVAGFILIHTRRIIFIWNKPRLDTFTVSRTASLREFLDDGRVDERREDPRKIASPWLRSKRAEVRRSRWCAARYALLPTLRPYYLIGVYETVGDVQRPRGEESLARTACSCKLCNLYKPGLCSH